MRSPKELKNLVRPDGRTVFDHNCRLLLKRGGPGWPNGSWEREGLTPQDCDEWALGLCQAAAETGMWANLPRQLDALEELRRAGMAAAA